jgi:hypothetical protein
LRSDDIAPNIIAGQIMIGLANDCSRQDIASGNVYCGTKAMALVALRGLLPSLSGMIHQHARFFVDNPRLPLGGMPFAST